MARSLGGLKQENNKWIRRVFLHVWALGEHLLEMQDLYRSLDN